MKLTLACAFVALLQATPGSLWAEEDSFPSYKPSSRSPQPLDIRTNAYGASRNAPDALGIGARVPDFTVPRAGGGSVSLSDARAKGEVAIIFYRGHG
jgi:hypothetical protein